MKTATPGPSPTHDGLATVVHLRPRRSGGSTPPSVEAHADDLCVGHGGYAYTLACTLLGDGAQALQAVVEGIVDFVTTDESTSVDDTRRSLARLVYRRSRQLVDTTSAPGQPRMMAEAAELARLQRACLALCLFGGHSHRDAADLIGISPRAAAGLLASGLDELGCRSRSAAPSV